MGTVLIRQSLPTSFFPLLSTGPGFSSSFSTFASPLLPVHFPCSLFLPHCFAFYRRSFEIKSSARRRSRLAVKGTPDDNVDGNKGCSDRPLYNVSRSNRPASKHLLLEASTSFAFLFRYIRNQSLSRLGLPLRVSAIFRLFSSKIPRDFQTRIKRFSRGRYDGVR